MREARRQDHGRQGHHPVVGADQSPAALMHPPVVGAADRDKVVEIGGASLRPVTQVVPINAQMWVAQAQPYSGAPPARLLQSRLSSPKPYGGERHKCAEQRLSGVRVGPSGDVIWRAALPQSSGDAFVDIAWLGGELVAHTWSGYRLILDVATGKASRQDFTK